MSADAGVAADAMTASIDEDVRLDLGDGESVSALWSVPDAVRVCCVLAHGAGAGMTHPFMTGLARALAGHGVAVLRYQFAFMERRSRRPDPPALAHAAVRAAVAHAGRRWPGLALFAGGKSFGGRMTSQADAASPLPDVRGIVFVGFPLHPARQPGIDRAAHLSDVDKPMLFLQGTRDALADIGLVQEVAAGLGPRATLETIDGADHAFHVPARGGRSDAQVLQGLAASTAGWMRSVAAAGRDGMP